MGVPKDYRKAVYWYKKAIASDPNNALALWNLSVMFEYGYGVDKDSGLANVLLIKCAKAGDAEAISRMKQSHGVQWDIVPLKPSEEMRFTDLLAAAAQLKIEDQPAKSGPDASTKHQSERASQHDGPSDIVHNADPGAIVRNAIVGMFVLVISIVSLISFLGNKRRGRKAYIPANKFALRSFKTTPNGTLVSSPTSYQQEKREGVCRKCGYERKETDDAPLWQCPACGIAYSKVRLQQNILAPGRATIGTRWLTFWTYFHLLVGGIGCIILASANPRTWIILGPLGILELVVAYGLHNRKLWAWQSNWAIIVLYWILMGIPTSGNSGAHFWLVYGTIRIILIPLWLWPNYVYWMKRKTLFS